MVQLKSDDFVTGHAQTLQIYLSFQTSRDLSFSKR